MSHSVSHSLSQSLSPLSFSSSFTRALDSRRCVGSSLAVAPSGINLNRVSPSRRTHFFYTSLFSFRLLHFCLCIDPVWSPTDSSCLVTLGFSHTHTHRHNPRRLSPSCVCHRHQPHDLPSLRCYGFMNTTTTTCLF